MKCKRLSHNTQKSKFPGRVCDDDDLLTDKHSFLSFLFFFWLELSKCFKNEGEILTRCISFYSFIEMNTFEICNRVFMFTGSDPTP
jgi:hypothetical protein